MPIDPTLTPPRHGSHDSSSDALPSKKRGRGRPSNKNANRDAQRRHRVQKKELFARLVAENGALKAEKLALTAENSALKARLGGLARNAPTAGLADPRVAQPVSPRHLPWPDDGLESFFVDLAPLSRADVIETSGSSGVPFPSDFTAGR